MSGATTTVLEDSHIDTVRRATLEYVIGTMNMTRGLLEDLAQARDLSEGTRAVDARNSWRILKDELEALECLGWPEST